MTTAGIVPTI